ncbi:unnamed protein product, partial [Rotaria magnacalcarata]
MVENNSFPTVSQNVIEEEDDDDDSMTPQQLFQC